MDTVQVSKDVLNAYKTVVALGLSLDTYHTVSDDNLTEIHNEIMFVPKLKQKIVLNLGN